jgi:hypothetical protein
VPSLPTVLIVLLVTLGVQLARNRPDGAGAGHREGWWDRKRGGRGVGNIVLVSRPGRVLPARVQVR